MNRVFLIGRTTKDIELRTTSGGKTYIQFTLAVNRIKEGTDFINCVAWNATAELMEKYVLKGEQVGVVGRIQTRNYEKDGKTVYVTEVVVDEVEFLGGNR